MKRVVFLATPHRGSDYARRFVGRVGTSLITEPDDYSKLIDQLVKVNPDTFPRRIRHLPTSIETLDPESPVLSALLKMPVNPGVALHSIIGSIRPEAQNQYDRRGRALLQRSPRRGGVRSGGPLRP